MFQRTLAFLFSVMLISTAARADQNALTDVGLQEHLIDDRGNRTDRQLNSGTCPAGFTYVPLARSCYMVLYENQNWGTAFARCQQLASGSHLVVIGSAAENDALKTFLSSQMPYHPACTRGKPTNAGGFWTAGQRTNANSCRNSPFVWKPTSLEQWAFLYSYWIPGEPNCRRRRESCVHIWPITGFGWNDENCNTKMCPLCEYNSR